jgi:glutamine amidotransferase
MIAIVNFGLGNVGAFTNMYKRMNIPTRIVTRPADLDGATHVILPGVGAFDHAMELLNSSGMREPLDALKQTGQIPILGVCVGMQILADSSDEGSSSGLGWISGRVRMLSENTGSAGLPMPHMGWNKVCPVKSASLFTGLEGDASFYFLHSYYFECADFADEYAFVEYGSKFTCSVRRGRVFGVQFHPEKSHHWGAALLKNFAEI